MLINNTQQLFQPGFSPTRSRDTSLALRPVTPQLLGKSPYVPGLEEDPKHAFLPHLFH